MTTSPTITLLDPAGYRRTPWKNGGGVTVDIADRYRDGVEAGGWTGMVWRFGRTRISVPAPFSDLSGLDRVQAVVVGRGLVLRRTDGSIVDVREPFRSVRYPGEWPLMSELEDGPVEVLNLIGARGAVDLDLRFAGSGETLPLARGRHVAYAPAEPAIVEVGASRIELPTEGGAILDLDCAGRLAVTDGFVALASITEPVAAG